MSALAPLAPRLRQLILLLSSNQDGEVVAAARAIDRTLRSADADWHVLADGLVTVTAAQRPPPKRPTPPPPATWASVDNQKAFLDRIKDEPWLSAWDREFVSSIRERLGTFMPRAISEKQRNQLDRLVRRAVERGVAI